MAEHEAKSEDALATAAIRHAVELTDLEKSTIRKAAAEADDQQAMTAAGLYLSKLSLPVNESGMRAVYAAQVWGGSDVAARRPFAPDVSRVAEEDAPALAALLSGVVVPESSATIAAQAFAEASLLDMSSQSGEGGSGDLQHELLNEQDDGSVAYSYGSLPVIVGDQLIELDVVHFRERDPEQRSSGSRRVIVSLNTQALGKIEIVAQVVGEHLSVAIKTQSPAANEALATHANEVRELAARLGWTVDAVTYEIGPLTHRAARHVVDHVLSAGTLSRWM
jgi:hypothetical protein